MFVDFVPGTEVTRVTGSIELAKAAVVKLPLVGIAAPKAALATTVAAALPAILPVKFTVSAVIPVQSNPVFELVLFLIFTPPITNPGPLASGLYALEGIVPIVGYNSA